MKRFSFAFVVASTLSIAGSAQAELLAMLNYESAAGAAVRQEGIAIIDIDPASPNYKQMLVDMPLPPDLVAHHIFYNPEMTKAYVTALGRSELRVMDMTRNPYRTNIIATPECKMLEDIVFSRKLGRWYMTCMGSSNLMVGDDETDEVIDVIELPQPWPHGIAINDELDRILVTSTVRSDLKAAGEHITVIKASTNEVLSFHKVSLKDSPSGAAPVEVAFVPHSDPAVAYITNMFEGSLWKATWRADRQEFEFEPFDDLAARGQGVPLEVYFSGDATRAYVSAAKPGHLNVYDVTDPASPKHLMAVPAAAGAHHMAFSQDGRLVFVQNSLLNLEGMSDGSISVIDLEKGEKIDSIDTLKNAGLRPNCIVLLPEYGSAHTH
jgi:DNA-binding beta-propeller fold protein YncE